MNIREVFPKTLWKKNGMRAPALAVARMVMDTFPESRKRTPNSEQARMQNPEESPLTPSIRLMALMIPMEANSVRMMAAHAGIFPIPQSPWKSLTLYPP